MTSENLFELGTLNESDTLRYNAFLTEAVQRHTDTLRISPIEIAAYPFQVAGSVDNVTFVARRRDEWLGVCSVEREKGRAKRAHIAWVMRMIVVPAASGKGIGRILLRAAIDRAAKMPGVEKLNLTVAAHNAPAIHLYKSEGFTEFAREEDAFRDSEKRTELTMSRKVHSD